LPEEPTGPLNTQILQALLVTTEIITENNVEKSHYKDYFNWRSNNLKGYKALYKKFFETLDRSTKKSFGCSFIGCDKGTQYEMLKKAFEVQTTKGRIDRIRKGLFDRDWLLFNKYIFPEILSLFARTDAWVSIGYDSWPGVPIGRTHWQMRLVHGAGVHIGLRKGREFHERDRELENYKRTLGKRQK
jgi:hypothetical protein